MNYIFNKNTDEKQIDDFVINSEQNNLFQCSNWAKVKNNWHHYFTSMSDEDGKIVASALILSRDFPLGKKLFYIPRGPVMDYHNKELVEAYFSKIKELAKEDKAIAVIFDPKVYSRKYLFKDRNENIPLENEDIVQTLINLGAKHKGYTKMIIETHQPRYNAEMDVEEGYYDQLDRKTIRSINTSVKKGTEYYYGPEYIDDFAEAMHYTEERKGIALRNKDYFQNMIDAYGEDCLLGVAKLNFPKQIKTLEERIASAKNDLDNPDISRKQKNTLQESLKNDEEELTKIKEDYAVEGKDEIVLTGILAIFNKKMMEIVYMGNNPRAMRIRASYYLYNKCIELCEKKHIKECSFGGIEGTLDDGLTVFKSNFIMNVEEYIGEFTFVLDPLFFNLFDSVYPKLLTLVGKFRK